MPQDNTHDDLAELIGISNESTGDSAYDEEVRRAYPDAYPQPPAPTEPAAPEVAPTLLACLTDAEALADMTTSCACATCPVAVWQIRTVPDVKGCGEVIYCHCPRLHQATYNSADLTQFTVAACDGREDELMRKGLEPHLQQPTATNTP